MRGLYNIAYLAHSLRSDWNNGNAHFLRGLMRALGLMGHVVTTYEPRDNWSITNLRAEDDGERSLADFATTYHDLNIVDYSVDDDDDVWVKRLSGCDVVILHEWNPPELASMLLRVRARCGFALLFHDTHHRASSSPEQMQRFGLADFDGVLAFGESLRSIYRDVYGLERVWTLHEAADTTVFRPIATEDRSQQLVWVGNWGEGDRSHEIKAFLLGPAACLRGVAKTTIYGVRYPKEGLQALAGAGVAYGGYLPNLDAPRVYAAAGMTVHVPRQQYTQAMRGIPTIRVFEALACGIPILSAPWVDVEGLFRASDFTMVEDGAAMLEAMRGLLAEPERAAVQAARGRETVLARHTCAHRAQELTGILEELRG